MDLTTERTGAIRAANDAFRSSLGTDPIFRVCPGQVMLTEAVQALPPANRKTLLLAVVAFTDFNAGNDPHGEHDFGSVEETGETYYFKLDYYAPGFQAGSDDPADLRITARVLTIMHASEY